MQRLSTSNKQALSTVPQRSVSKNRDSDVMEISRDLTSWSCVESVWVSLVDVLSTRPQRRSSLLDQAQIFTVSIKMSYLYTSILTIMSLIHVEVKSKLMNIDTGQRIEHPHTGIHARTHVNYNEMKVIHKFRESAFILQ